MDTVIFRLENVSHRNDRLLHDVMSYYSHILRICMAVQLGSEFFEDELIVEVKCCDVSERKGFNIEQFVDTQPR